ncbi:ferrous iron transporter B [Halanaerobacter jeridensis]|uniref:ferrous iron transporter B n=1 Tax=Halanaerobacter jeridensis TaxID=706427 RepID=UPI0034DF49EE
MRVALTGNPNSGKTTLFNAITGEIAHVGNWSGVTMDKKAGEIKENLNQGQAEVTAVDLPGAYSMSPFTSEENITKEFVKNEDPDVIINIVDATNLSRSLFFTTQLLELGIPVVVALNKSDLIAKKNIDLDREELSELLGCPVVNTVATKNQGLEDLVSAVHEVKAEEQAAPFEAGDVDLTDRSAVEAADKRRFEFVKSIIDKVETREVESNQQTIQDTVDRVVAHKWLGIPIFAVIMWAVFSLSQTHVGPLFADIFVGWIDQLNAGVASMLGDSVSPVLRAILLDGIIGGVGAVVGFLPLIMVLFFLLALLEDCGYMARVTVVMDRFFKKVGLSGRSIIPMIIGTGCAIPGVMATRTIKDKRQRRTTAMLTPFMPCGAKLPVIALFAGAFFNDAGWVGTTMYFLGIGIIIIGALIVRKITGDKSTRSPFIMELPEYRFPSIKRATKSMASRGKAFVIKAGTIILICNAAVQIMQTFNWQFEVVAEGAQSTSILASIASPFSILLIPLGFGAWQLAAAAITGFIAKENVVGTLAVVYSITNFINPEEFALVGDGTNVASVMGLTSVAALAYLVFNLFTPPCFAAIGAMNAELESKKWLWGAIGFQFSVGYIASFLTYQVGTLITTGSLGTGFLPGLIAVGAMMSVIVYFMTDEEEVQSEATVNA